MKVVVVGSSGIVGGAVAQLLGSRGHEVLGLSRRSTPALDLADAGTIVAALDQVEFDALVSTAANTPMLSLTDLDPEVLRSAIAGKLLGQLALLAACLQRDPAPASVTLTSGEYGTPAPQMSAGALVNAGLEQFVRHAATEIRQGTRVNVVRPGWVQETLDTLGLDQRGTPASVIAGAYLSAIDGKADGEILIPST